MALRGQKGGRIQRYRKHGRVVAAYSGGYRTIERRQSNRSPELKPFRTRR